MKNIKKIWLILIAVLLALPGVVFAQTAQDQDPSFVLQTGKSSTTLIILTKSSQANRYLGDVKIKIIADDLSGDFTVSDPPSPDGFRIKNVPTDAKIEIVAERKAYEPYNRTVQLKKQTYNTLEIKLSPYSYVPRVTKSSINRFSYSNVDLYSDFSEYFDEGDDILSSVARTALYNSNYPLYSDSSYLKPNLAYFSGDSISGLARNYKIDEYEGDFYLVSRSNQFDRRKIVIADRGDGKGGLAFFAAGTTLDSDYYPENENAWYAMLYSAENSKIDFDLGTASRVNFSPQNYARVVKATLVDNIFY